MSHPTILNETIIMISGLTREFTSINVGRGRTLTMVTVYTPFPNLLDSSKWLIRYVTR